MILVFRNVVFGAVEISLVMKCQHHPQNAGCFGDIETFI